MLSLSDSLEICNRAFSTFSRFSESSFTHEIYVPVFPGASRFIRTGTGIFEGKPAWGPKPGISSFGVVNNLGWRLKRV
jgi:hypothetical protein